VTISPVGPDRVRIDGWTSCGGATIELRQDAECVRTRSSESGRFVFDDVTRGMTRFLIRLANGAGQPAATTPAVEI